MVLSIIKEDIIKMVHTGHSLPLSPFHEAQRRLTRRLCREIQFWGYQWDEQLYCTAGLFLCKCARVLAKNLQNSNAAAAAKK